MLRALALAAAALALVAALVTIATLDSADAHTLLQRSDPAAGVVFPADQPPRRVSLWFTEPVTAARNAIVILDTQDRRISTSPATVAVDDARRLDVSADPLPPGAYAVRWQVTAADNHVARGTYWFVVSFAATPPPAISLLGSRPPPVPAIETLARWLGLVAALVLAGAPLFHLLVRAPVMRAISRAGDAMSPRAGSPAADAMSPAAGSTPLRVISPDRTVPLAFTAIFAAAHVLAAVAQVEAVAGLPLRQALDRDTVREVLLGSRFAALWWLRLLLGVGVGAALVRAPHSPISMTHATSTSTAAVLLLVCTAMAGHASGGPWFGATVAIDAVHLIGAAIWLGGLVQLARWLGCARSRSAGGESIGAPLAALVPRFSLIAATSVLVLLVTGALNAVAQVGSFTMLARTVYGQSLILKLAVIVPLLAIAAINRFIVRPRLVARHPPEDSQLTRRLHRLVRAEVALVIVVLLVVGLLGSLPPPARMTLPSSVHAGREAGPLRVSLTVDPNWVGVSRFRVGLAERDGRPPTDVRQVIATFAMEGMNMGRTHVTLAPRGAGVYETEGFYVGMPGISQIGIAIGRADSADQSAVFRIEVPDVNATQFAGLGALLARGGGDDASRTVDVARGRDIYMRQCTVCHGETGVGNGAAAPSLLPPPADLTLHARWHADEQLFWFITHGVTGTSMPGFSDKLDARDRWNVIAHLHALAAAPTASIARGAPASTGSVPRAAPTPVAPAPATVAPGMQAPAPATPAPRRPGDTTGARSAAAPARDAPSVTPSSAPIATQTTRVFTGRLIFGPDFDNNLWLLRLPDGRPAPLTRLGPLEFSSNPAWSPDGKRIAFSYYRLPGGDAIPVPDGTDLYVINADGVGLRALAVHDVPGATFQYPAWAPDGTAVYATYVRQGGATVSVERVDVRSGSRTRVASDANFPSPSRDGRRLAVVRSAVPPARGQSLWVSATDGSAARQIIGADVFDKLFAVRFAPDGNRLLFAAVGQPAGASRPLGRLDPLRLLSSLFRPTVAHANGDLWELWVVDVSGSNLRPLTTLSEDLPVGAWAPDGKHVAFLGGGSASSAEAGLSVIRADGSTLVRLTTQPGHRGVDWAAPEIATSVRAR